MSEPIFAGLKVIDCASFIAGPAAATILADHGAEMAFSYQGEALKKRVEPLAASIGTPLLFECDVADEASMDAVFAGLKDTWGTIDFVVHAIGFSDKNELRGRYVDTSRANFQMTMDISVYSFTAVCQRAAAMMPEGGSLLTLTYYGAEKVMPHYNVMGVAKAALESATRYLANDLGPQKIRVNAISPGPITTPMWGKFGLPDEAMQAVKDDGDWPLLFPASNEPDSRVHRIVRARGTGQRGDVLGLDRQIRRRLPSSRQPGDEQERLSASVGKHLVEARAA